MSKLLIVITGLIYTWVAIEQGYKLNWPMAWIYLTYAASNIGLYLLVK